ncbi:hypothetical protein [Gordonia soli]|uniref:Uncharacterized protein n=1 Tax=Gordonia soli NBRC 108243 TaxID=1223545 RepID=M0QN85_9ACTN|nr:hypothetical protein [Gordonia soli]GAC68867.1 hypothetical protein GS4_19_00570 [Gordonia soli NBRC 108243]
MPISGYLAPRRERPTAPVPIYDQATKRERRRRWLTVVLDDQFRLDDEVAAICGPIALRAVDDPTPAANLTRIEAVADAVSGLCVAAAELVADSDIRRLDATNRRRAREAMRAVSRSALPTITADDLADGSWVEPLVDLARPHTAPLAHLLGRQASDRRGGPTASEAMLTVLRDLDRAALAAHRRLDAAERHRAQVGSRTAPTDPAQAARDTLRELGLGTSEQETT